MKLDDTVHHMLARASDCLEAANYRYQTGNDQNPEDVSKVALQTLMATENLYAAVKKLIQALEAS